MEEIRYPAGKSISTLAIFIADVIVNHKFIGLQRAKYFLTYLEANVKYLYQCSGIKAQARNKPLEAQRVIPCSSILAGGPLLYF